nr:hypothetical protein [Tanacetum cinerariifolium]
MEDDLFTYEGEVAIIPCNLNMDDDSEQLIGNDEVELTDEEFSDNEDDVAKDIIGFKTYEDYKDGWICEWNKNVPWVCDKPWLDNGIWKEPTLVKYTCKPFNYKTGCSEWPTCSWREDGYCNGGNLSRAYHIGNSLHYWNLEWYEALEDSDLKEQALRNKSIMEGSISDEESSNDCWKRWRSHEITYYDHDEIEYKNETHDKRQELCEAHKLPVCNIRKFEMIKYSSRHDEEHVAVKEDKYDDLARRSNDAYRTYQEIFRRMDKALVDTLLIVRKTHAENSRFNTQDVIFSLTIVPVVVHFELTGPLTVTPSKIPLTFHIKEDPNDQWEDLLDIDDSDLPLTPVLRGVEKKPVRIIPSPTGIVQLAKIRKKLDIHEGGDDSVLSIQEYMKQVVEDVGDDEDFNSGPWVGVTDGVGRSGILMEKEEIVKVMEEEEMADLKFHVCGNVID